MLPRGRPHWPAPPPQSVEAGSRSDRVRRRRTRRLPHLASRAPGSRSSCLRTRIGAGARSGRACRASGRQRDVSRRRRAGFHGEPPWTSASSLALARLGRVDLDQPHAFAVSQLDRVTVDDGRDNGTRSARLAAGGGGRGRGGAVSPGPTSPRARLPDRRHSRMPARARVVRRRVSERHGEPGGGRHYQPLESDGEARRPAIDAGPANRYPPSGGRPPSRKS